MTQPGFVSDFRQVYVTPKIAQNSGYSALDGRWTRHEGYVLSQMSRNKIEEPFGWAKTVGGIAQTMCGGVERVRSRFILTMAVNNPSQLSWLLGA